MTSAPFTIFLPVRNGENYVRQAIESVHSQKDSDWRLVVLENASTDSTVAIVRSFVDPRIELVPSAEPLSIEDNWHRIRTFVEREGADSDALMTFMGHDDYLYPNFVARAKALAAAAPDATLYQFQFDLVDKGSSLIRPCRPVPHLENWMDLAAMIGWGLRDAVGTGLFWRASDYLKVGGMPRLPGILFADHLLFLRLTKLGYKRADTASACAYRLHDSSMTSAHWSRGLNLRAEAFVQFVDALVREFPELAEADLGRLALMTLIARELLQYDGLPKRSLTPVNRQRLQGLRDRLSTLGGSDDPAHWSYQTTRYRRLRAQISFAKMFLAAG